MCKVLMLTEKLQKIFCKWVCWGRGTGTFSDKYTLQIFPMVINFVRWLLKGPINETHQEHDWHIEKSEEAVTQSILMILFAFNTRVTEK